jgi:class 3 adenylate cyclase
MASLLSIDQIEQGMMDIASNVLFIDKGFVMLLNQKEQVYENISGPSSTLKLPAHDPLIQKIAEGKRAVTRYDIEEDPLFNNKRPACVKTWEQLDATLMVPIIYENDLIGMISLGEKKSGRFYRVEDINLLKTLASQGAVAIENARSFEEIKDLNQELAGRKLQLENTLGELQAAMRKTEILESLKANLYKFVPTTVAKLLEKSPEAVSFGSKEQDLSVMFLDIEGYTSITETLGATVANDIVERYFSVFMDAIYENNGDVMETAGDSLMVLFLSEDKTTNALEAVRSALMIRDKSTLVNQESGLPSQPLKINIGVSSGQAIVGASKFESYTGARWTYSATGMVVNLAARICAHASGGAVLASKTTMERVKNQFFCKSMGKFELKNISGKVELFAIDEGAKPNRHFSK